MLYLYEPKLIKSLWRVWILANAGLPEPPLVDGHGISKKSCVVAQLECKCQWQIVPNILKARGRLLELLK